MTTLHSVGDTLLNLWNQVGLYVPKLIGAAILLIVGYFIARIVNALVTKGLRLVHFDQVADRAGITAMLQRAGSKMDGARLLGTIAFWWIFLMFIDMALNALALPTITTYVNLLVAYIPRLFVAFLIVVIGALIANVVAGAIRGATAETGTTTSGLLGTVAKWFILLFAVLTAITELGVAESMIFILFASAMGMVALAGGLAFGLGGRETAAQIINNWYSRNQQGAPQLGQPAAQRQQPIPGGYRAPQTARYSTTDPASQQDLSRQS
jgi:hypothetical protein